MYGFRRKKGRRVCPLKGLLGTEVRRRRLRRIAARSGHDAGSQADPRQGCPLQRSGTAKAPFERTDKAVLSGST